MYWLHWVRVHYSNSPNWRASLKPAKKSEEWNTCVTLQLYILGFALRFVGYEKDEAIPRQLYQALAGIRTWQE